MPEPAITQAGPGLAAHLHGLADQADREGHGHVRRLIAEWSNGTNCFNRPGEVLLVAQTEGQTVGIGGLTLDPHLPGALRVRRFYVAPDHRNSGLGKRMARRILDAVQGPRVVTCHAPTPEATAFWRTLGFADAHAPHHNLTLTVP